MRVQKAASNLINPAVACHPAFSVDEDSQTIKSERDFDDLGDDVTPAVDLLELMLQDSLELDRAWEARATPLYFQLKRRHTGWMYKLFRTRVWNDADIEELINETFARSLERLRRTFWATNGVNVQSEPVFDENGQLIGESFRPAKPIIDLERYTLWSPGGFLGSIARSVLNKYVNKSAAEIRGAEEFNCAVESPAQTTVDDESHDESQGRQSSEILDNPLRNPEVALIREAEAREIRKRYIEALAKLPAIQRTAWILCRDELLTSREGEPMLVPVLHWRTARSALRRKPLRDAEVSGLLGRVDVSPDAAKAKAKLGLYLSDLNPFPDRVLPVPKWPREYLVGSSNRSGSLKRVGVRWEELCEPDEHRSETCERDKDFIRDMPGRDRPHENIRLRRQERTQAYSMDVKPGWFSPPEADPPEYVELIKIMRPLLRARKGYSMTARVLNDRRVPPRLGNKWHPTAVRVIAIRARLVKPRVVEPGANGGTANEAAQDDHRNDKTENRLHKAVGKSRAGNNSPVKRTREKPKRKARRSAVRRKKSGKPRPTRKANLPHESIGVPARRSRSAAVRKPAKATRRRASKRSAPNASDKNRLTKPRRRQRLRRNRRSHH